MKCKACPGDVPTKRERFGTCCPNCHEKATRGHRREKARERYAAKVRASIEDDEVLTGVRRHGASYTLSGLRGMRHALTERIIYDALMAGRV